MSLAELQRYATLQQGVTDRVNQDGDRIADMVTRLAMPTKERVDADSVQIQSMAAQLAQQSFDRVRQQSNKLQRMGAKLITTPADRTMGDATALTGILARVQSQGFPPLAGSASSTGVDPSATGMVPNAAYSRGGRNATPTGARGVGLPGAASGSPPQRNRPGVGATAATGVSDIAGSIHPLPKRPPRNPPPASAPLPPLPPPSPLPPGSKQVSGGCVDASDPNYANVSLSLRAAGLPADGYAILTAISYLYAVGCAPITATSEFNTPFGIWLAANSPLQCGYSVTADLTPPPNAETYDPCTGEWILTDSTSYQVPLDFVQCPTCVVIPPPPPPSPPPPPPPPPPPYVTPPPPTPPQPGCDLCEAITYLGQVIMHCCPQPITPDALPPVPESPRWEIPPDYLPDVVEGQDYPAGLEESIQAWLQESTDAFAQGPPTGGAETGGFNPELFGD